MLILLAGFRQKKSKSTKVDLEEIRGRAKISVTTHKIVLYDFKREGSRATHQEEV